MERLPSSTPINSRTRELFKKQGIRDKALSLKLRIKSQMMDNRYKAQYGNMEYSFNLIAKADEEIEIFMYGSTYCLVKSENEWLNSGKNKFNLSFPLIKAVIEAVAK